MSIGSKFLRNTRPEEINPAKLATKPAYDSPMIVLHLDNGNPFGIKLCDICGFGMMGTTAYCSIENNKAKIMIQETLAVAVGIYNRALRKGAQ